MSGMACWISAFQDFSLSAFSQDMLPHLADCRASSKTLSGTAEGRVHVLDWGVIGGECPPEDQRPFTQESCLVNPSERPDTDSTFRAMTREIILGEAQWVADCEQQKDSHRSQRSPA